MFRLKISFLALCIGTICSPAFSQQTFSFSIKQVTAKQAIKALARQSQIPIAYNGRIFDSNKLLNMSFEEASLEEVLGQILKDSRVGYRKKAEHIILYKKKSKYYKLKGSISDAKTEEKLTGASIVIKGHNKRLFATEDGRFSLKLREGKYNLLIEHPGYQSREIPLLLTHEDKQLNIFLNSDLKLKEVLIISDRHQRYKSSLATIGRQVIHSELVKLSPAFAGEEDPLKQIAFLPGIQTASQGVGGLNVRGSDQSHNLIMLDGVPVYNAAHLLGIYSIFNQHAVDRTEMTRSGFSAQNGGRLSSVVNVISKDGDLKRWKLKAGMGMLGGNIHIGGPLWKDKASLMISGRKTLFSNFMRPSMNKLVSFFQDFNDLQFGFQDLHGKLHFRLTDDDRLDITYYEGGDRIRRTGYEMIFDENHSVSSLDHMDWGNKILAANWKHMFNAHAFANLNISYNKYHFNREESMSYEYLSLRSQGESFTRNTRSSIKDISTRLDFSYYPNGKSKIQVGTGITAHLLEPSIETVSASFDTEEVVIIDSSSQDLGIFTIPSVEGHLFAEYEFKPSPSLRLNLGTRLSYFFDGEIFFLNPEPRLRGIFTIKDNLKLNFGYSRMVQYLHQIRLGMVWPGDMWIPSGLDFMPQTSNQIDLGLQWKTNQWNWYLNAYIKQMNNLHLYNPSNTQRENDAFEDFSEGIHTGNGDAQGMELMIENMEGPLGGFLSYTYSKSNRYFPFLNLGVRFPFEYDNRHQLNLLVYKRFSKSFTTSVNWSYGSGMPEMLYFRETERKKLSPINNYIMGQRNLRRNRAYHHLDISALYQFKSNQSRLSHELKFGINNAYNRSNTVFHELIDPYSEDSPKAQVALFPFLPSIKYTLSF